MSIRFRNPPRWRCLGWGWLVWWRRVGVAVPDLEDEAGCERRHCYVVWTLALGLDALIVAAAFFAWP